MMKINSDYLLKKDIEFFLDAEALTMEELSRVTHISKATLMEIRKGKSTTKEVLEKFYSYVYSKNYRINSIKEELLKETNQTILFHGSKFGLNSIDIKDSRKGCDFGQGFYLGESYYNARSFVSDYDDSSVYSFSLDDSNLEILRLGCTIEWMLAICYYRRRLEEYKNHAMIKDIISKIEKADVVIAPIADNRMFYIMSLFTDGEITIDTTLHSLSASNLGQQFVIKTEKALSKLTCVEKMYLSNPEKKDALSLLQARSYEIDTKLKMAKREFRNGIFIEELLK